VPSYGEERRRGFNLRGGGYFFDISEYAKLALTGDIYSKGGHALYANSSYLKRYHYSGSLNFSYSKNPDSDDKIETENFTKDFRLTWSHSPQSKGTGRFSASVNAATTTYNQNNYLGYGTSADLTTSSLSNISTKLSSNISYSKRFTGTPFTMGLNMSHNQDLVTKIVDLSLPTLTVNMTNIYPFQRKNGSSNGPLDNFSVSYSMAASNRVTNNLGKIGNSDTDSIAPFNFNSFGRFFENGKKGIRHSIPASFSFKALRYFTVSPSVSYEEKWYFERRGWYEDPTTKEILRSDTIRKEFNRISNYSFSTSLTTRLYGTYFFKKKNSKIKAIRHIVNPSISFGFTPEFTGNRKYFQEFETNDSEGKPLTVYKSYHEGFVYGGSNTGKSGSIGFSLGNNLEAKVQGPQDSVARKVMLLNNLSFSSSYNIIADSFKLAPIGISANTNILNNKLNLNLSATLDPYNYVMEPVEGQEPVEKRKDYLAWKSGHLGRITSATLAMSTNLNPKARNKETTSREKIAKSNMPQQEKEFLIQNPDAYIDFEIPWSLNLSYNLSYTHAVDSDPNIVQTVSANGDLSLSEKWKVTYSTGYHFESKEFTQTNLGISRDLHCWTMHLNWTPFGRFQSFNFTINVKASILQDLKLERRKSFLDNL
jgi:hypothetical protein